MGFFGKKDKTPKQPTQSIESQLIEEAEAGDIEVQAKLGNRYINGEGGFEQDHQAAVKWLSLAAEAGHVIAQYNLGSLYSHLNVGDKAIKWLGLAADAGNAEAQNEIGYCYAKGEFVEKDLGKAVEFLRQAAQQGHETASNNLPKVERMLAKQQAAAVTTQPAAAVQASAGNNCTQCGATMQEGAKFCGGCGTKVELTKFCTGCGAKMDINSKFCGECGVTAGGEAVTEEQPVEVDAGLFQYLVEFPFDIDMPPEDFDGYIQEKGWTDEQLEEMGFILKKGLFIGFLQDQLPAFKKLFEDHRDELSIQGNITIKTNIDDEEDETCYYNICAVFESSDDLRSNDSTIAELSGDFCQLSAVDTTSGLYQSYCEGEHDSGMFNSDGDYFHESVEKLKSRYLNGDEATSSEGTSAQVFNLRCFFVPSDGPSDDKADFIDYLDGNARVTLVNFEDKTYSYTPVDDTVREHDGLQEACEEVSDVILEALKSYPEFSEEVTADLVTGLLAGGAEEDPDYLDDHCEDYGGEVVFGNESDTGEGYEGCLGCVAATYGEHDISVSGKNVTVEDFDDINDFEDLLLELDESRSWSVLYAK